MKKVVSVLISVQIYLLLGLTKFFLSFKSTEQNIFSKFIGSLGSHTVTVDGHMDNFTHSHGRRLKISDQSPYSQSNCPIYLELFFLPKIVMGSGNKSRISVRFSSCLCNKNVRFYAVCRVHMIPNEFSQPATDLTWVKHKRYLQYDLNYESLDFLEDSSCLSKRNNKTNPLILSTVNGANLCFKREICVVTWVKIH